MDKNGHLGTRSRKRTSTDTLTDNLVPGTKVSVNVDFRDPRLVDKIDALLPQTQCELCEHPGCKPYAEAIINQNESINKCLPGGVDTLKKLGALLNIDPEPYLESMQAKQKPAELVIIDEDICIGCTKCIQACPVDAIIGAGKQMHTIIDKDCNGCELCIPPCPVDCISIKILPEPDETAKQENTDHNRERFYARNSRLERIENEKKQKHQQAKLTTAVDKQTPEEMRAARLVEIQAAMQRTKQKRGH